MLRAGQDVSGATGLLKNSLNSGCDCAQQYLKSIFKISI
jgi:hypothetical protein